MKALPKKYDTTATEARWQQHWLEAGTYHWDESASREDTYVIDTPPPTVSGHLHMGHIFSYTQADFVARWQRMNGKTVFYPMGFDDNGLPTERLVEKSTKKRAVDFDSREDFIEACMKVSDESRVAYRDLFQSTALSVDWRQEYHTISERSRKISQLSFLDLMQKGHVERRLEPMLWDPVDQTAIAQAEVEDKELPSHFCDIRFKITSPTGRGRNSEAVSGEGVESSETASPHPNPLPEGEGTITIATTRPELIPACVAIFYHPDDERYQHLKGKYAITPLFGVKVPILEDDTVEMDKGTGIMMCCTFGDEADIEKWRKHKLPLRLVLNKYGKNYFDLVSAWQSAQAIVLGLDLYDPNDNSYALLTAGFDDNYSRHGKAAITNENCIDIHKAISCASKLNNLKAKAARETIIKMLRESGDLIDAKPITHAVKCAERSGAPLEILPTPQWFVKVIDKKAELKAKSAQCDWHPQWMAKRMEQWIDGLSWDWCISRQRYFGVPFPVWYVEKNTPSHREGSKSLISGEGASEGKAPSPETAEAVSTSPDGRGIILAAPEDLPINPLTTAPKGYELQEVRNGLLYCLKDGAEVVLRPDYDVMDTWFTSSVSPQLSSHGIGSPLPSGEVETAKAVSGEGAGYRDITPRILENARELRQSLTDAEALLWGLLRDRRFDGLKFRRQHPISQYIVDFFCNERNLIIELDGSQHAEDKAKVYDAERTRKMESEGYRVLRFWNNEMLQETNSVLEAIWNATRPHPKSKISTSPGGRGNYILNPERHAKLYPADLRPQAHEIIRTWAFYTLVKSHLHGETIPWQNLMISGWCLAEDKQKMSKSKGNVVTPIGLIEEHGADVVRYWASTSKLGQDTAFSRDLLKIGKKLVNKLWNATKFAAIHLEKLSDNDPSQWEGSKSLISREGEENSQTPAPVSADASPTPPSGRGVTSTLDRWILSRLHRATAKAGEEFARYEYAAALRAIEDFFWNDFCDNYLELVKKRAYGENRHPVGREASAQDPGATTAADSAQSLRDSQNDEGQMSAVYTIHHCLDGILRLFAPFLPHVTEELWSHIFESKYEQTGSIHARGNWPRAEDYLLDETAEAQGIAAVEVLETIRKAKSEKGVSIKWPIREAMLSDKNAAAPALDASIVQDICAAGNVDRLLFSRDDGTVIANSPLNTMAEAQDAAAITPCSEDVSALTSETGRYGLTITFAEESDAA